MKFLLLELLLIISLFIVINYLLHKKNEHFNENPQIKWIVLLTTAVNGDEKRIKLYEEKINKWLNNTELPIYVVESSGYDFPNIKHKRFHLYTFNLIKYKDSTSSTLKEAESILYILDKIKDEPEYINADYILKVTGRYFLPNIEDELKKCNDNTKIYVQKHRYGKFQHTEYFGIEKNQMAEFMDKVINGDKIMEHIFYDFTENNPYVFMNQFKNNVPRGGDGIVINPL